MRVFKRTESGWEYFQDLRHPDPEGDLSDGYGRTIQVEDGLALVGALHHGSEGGTVCPDGRIYSFVLEQGIWTYNQTLRAPFIANSWNCPNTFGEGFAFDGELLVAGARAQFEVGAPKSGMAYIFRRDAADDFSLEQTLPAPDQAATAATAGSFGIQTEVSEGRVFITITGNPGGVLLYELVGGVWAITHEFVQPLSGGQDWGYSLSYENSRLALGSLREDSLQPSPRDYVRVYLEQAPGNWIVEHEFWVSGPGMDPRDFPRFSRSLKLDRDWLVVGAPGVQPVPVVGAEHAEGRVFVYRRNDATGWNLIDDFSYSESSNMTLTIGSRGGFGSSVALDVERGQLAANAPGYRIDLGDDPSARIRGGVYVFDLELGEVYCQQGNLNSAGLTGALSIMGSARVLDGNMTLHAHHLPPLTTALFLFGQPGNPIPLALGGELCLGGTLGVGRFPLSAPVLESGEAFLRLDLQSPFLSSLFTSGSTWGFQVWHREPGNSATHMTHAVSLTLN